MAREEIVALGNPEEFFAEPIGVEGLGNPDEFFDFLNGEKRTPILIPGIDVEPEKKEPSQGSKEDGVLRTEERREPPTRIPGLESIHLPPSPEEVQEAATEEKREPAAVPPEEEEKELVGLLREEIRRETERPTEVPPEEREAVSPEERAELDALLEKRRIGSPLIAAELGRLLTAGLITEGDLDTNERGRLRVARGPEAAEEKPGLRERIREGSASLRRRKEEISNWQEYYNRWREGRKPYQDWTDEEKEEDKQLLERLMNAGVTLTSEHIEFLEEQGVDVEAARERREEIERETREEMREGEERITRRFFERLKTSVQRVVDTWKELPKLWKRDKKLALNAVLAGGVSGAGFGFAGGAAVGAASVALAGTPLAAVAVGAGITVGVGYLKARFDHWWLERHMQKTFTQIEEQLRAAGELANEEIAARIEADKKGYTANFIITQIITGIAGGLAGKYLGQKAVESLLAPKGTPTLVKVEKPAERPAIEEKIIEKPRVVKKVAEGPVKAPIEAQKRVIAPLVREVVTPPEVNMDTLLNTKLEGRTLWGSLEKAVNHVVEANPKDQFVASSFETGVTNTQWTTDAMCDLITKNGAAIPDWQGKTIAELLGRDPEVLRFITNGMTTKDPKKLLELYLKFRKYKANIGI